MEKSLQIDEMVKELAPLRNEAARIVASASAEGRELTEAEDSHVLSLMKRVRILEEDVTRFWRHNGECAKWCAKIRKQHVGNA